MQPIRPTRPARKPHNKPEPQTNTAPDVGEAVEAVTVHELQHSCHLPIIFFTPPQKFQITYTRFQDVLYSLTFSCQGHTSSMSYILYIFVFLSPV